MATIEAEEVLTQDSSSQRVHRRFRLPGETELLTFEGDNLDVAGEFDIIESTAGIDAELFCKRCFPDGPPATS